MELICIIFLGAIAVFLISSVNQAKAEQSVELKDEGVINHISQVRFVKGIPDIDEGTIVTIYLYNNKITISENQVIPLENIRQATTFKVKQVLLANQGDLKKAILDWLLPKRLGILIRCIMNTKTLTFLSVEFVDQQGQECNGMFFSDNHQNINRLAEDINRQTDMVLKGHILT